MRVRVYVSLKQTVLDPQGKTICAALQGMGYQEIQGVRQGKYFEIELTGVEDAAAAKERMVEVAREVLANPVIEDFQVEMLGESGD